MTKLKLQENLRESQDSGYTIIEALMAMVVVSVLMISIAPVLVFATGTRLQARRVELATQAAKTYIDGVRSGAIPVATFSGTTITPIIETKVLAATADRNTFKVDAPSASGSLSCSGDGYCQTPASLYCVNLDDTAGCSPNSVKDMIIQAYRSIPSTTATNPRDGYLLGVRVYRAGAFKSGVTLLADPQAQQQSTITGGIGNITIPVVQMTTEIGSSNGGTSTPFQNLCARVGCN